MKTRICSKCKEEKEVCEFGVCSSNKDGLKSSCKVCRKIEGKIYRENNVEKRKKTIKNWYNKKTILFNRISETSKLYNAIKKRIGV